MAPPSENIPALWFLLREIGRLIEVHFECDALSQRFKCEWKFCAEVLERRWTNWKSACVPTLSAAMLIVRQNMFDEYIKQTERTQARICALYPTFISQRDRAVGDYRGMWFDGGRFSLVWIFDATSSEGSFTARSDLDYLRRTLHVDK